MCVFFRKHGDGPLPDEHPEPLLWKGPGTRQPIDLCISIQNLYLSASSSSSFSRFALDTATGVPVRETPLRCKPSRGPRLETVRRIRCKSNYFCERQHPHPYSCHRIDSFFIHGSVESSKRMLNPRNKNGKPPFSILPVLFGREQQCQWASKITGAYPRDFVTPGIFRFRCRVFWLSIAGYWDLTPVSLPRQRGLPPDHSRP